MLYIRRYLLRRLSSGPARYVCLLVVVPTITFILGLYVGGNRADQHHVKINRLTFPITRINYTRILKPTPVINHPPEYRDNSSEYEMIRDRRDQDSSNVFGVGSKEENDTVDAASAGDTEGGAAGSRIISIHLPPGRAGNVMFALASLLGIANLNGFTPQLSGEACSQYRRVFRPAIRCNASLAQATFVEFREKFAGKFDHRVVQLSAILPGQTPILLNGYFQSWKYFYRMRDTLPEYFIFKDDIMAKVRRFFHVHNITRDALRAEKRRSEGGQRLIGVHVRQGDMASVTAEFQGYIAAPPAYINNAMIYMESRYSDSDIIFVVASDDIGWCKENVNQVNRRVVFSETFVTAEDLALLSACDDVIATSGTFGWWGAHLAGGHTAYYSLFPLEGSPLSSMMSRRDYYPPHWVGLSELRGDILNH